MASALKLPHQPHGSLERSTHTAVMLASVFMFSYSAYKISEELKNSVLMEVHLKQGWQIFNRKKDGSDEWVFWKELYLNIMWKWFALHMLLGQICKSIGAHQIKKYLFALCHLTFLFSNLGPFITIFHVVQIFLPVISAHFTASTKVVWLSSLGFFVLYDASYAGKALNDFIPLLPSGSALYCCQEYLFQVGIMKSTSCSLFIIDTKKSSIDLKTGSHVTGDKSDRSETETDDLKWDWADVVCYNFYFPLAVFGPFVTFKEFLSQFNRSPPVTLTTEVNQKMTKYLLKSCLWIVIYETILHYFYFSAILQNPRLLEGLPIWSLIGLACLQAQMFMVRHFIIWTLVSPVSLLDNLETPSAPSCVCRVYLYSDMWKSFDKGFYKFLKEHIYLPLGGRRQGTSKYIRAVTLTFAFALFFHGSSISIVTWIVINVLSMFLEKMVHGLFSTECFDSEKGSKISPSWNRRLHSFIHVPLFVFSTFGSFLFLAGRRATYLIAYRIFFEGFPMSYAMLFLGCFSFIQTTKDYENYTILKTLKSQ